jgi:hypothetical protein
MRFLATFLGACAGMAAALFAPLAHAQADSMNPCIFDLPCIGGGAEGLGAFVEDSVIPYLVILFVGMAFWAFFYYAYRLVTESRENENTVKEAKGGYEQLIYACAIVGIAAILVSTFGREAAGTLVNPDPLTGALAEAALWFRILVGCALTAIMVSQGFLIIISSEDGEIDKHRKRLINAVIGVGIILLANSIVAALQPGSNSGILADEVRGIANYLLVIFIVLAVLAVIIAGAFLLFSIDEGLKDKAKAIIKTAVISAIIVLCSYLIVFYFINM